MLERSSTGASCGRSKVYGNSGTTQQPFGLAPRYFQVDTSGSRVDPTATSPLPYPPPSSMPGFCSKCGSPVLTDAIFCHRCGQNFTAEMAAVQLPGHPEAAHALTALREALADRYAVARELGR